MVFSAFLCYFLACIIAFYPFYMTLCLCIYPMILDMFSVSSKLMCFFYWPILTHCLLMEEFSALLFRYHCHLWHKRYILLFCCVVKLFYNLLFGIYKWSFNSFSIGLAIAKIASSVLSECFYFALQYIWVLCMECTPKLKASFTQ